jgi:hypothetical protein
VRQVKRDFDGLPIVLEEIEDSESDHQSVGIDALMQIMADCAEAPFSLDKRDFENVSFLVEAYVYFAHASAPPLTLSVKDAGFRK